VTVVLRAVILMISLREMKTRTNHKRNCQLSTVGERISHRVIDRLARQGLRW